MGARRVLFRSVEVFTEEQRFCLSEAARVKRLWKKQTITILLHHVAEKEAKVKAEVLGSWAVHTPLSGGRGPAITHAPTGYLFTHARSRVTAKAGIEAMVAAEPDFRDLGAEDLRANVSVLRKWARDIEDR